MQESTNKLVSQVAVTGAAHTNAVSAISSLVAEVSTLNAKLAATGTAAVIFDNSDDARAINKCVADLNASTLALVAAMPNGAVSAPTHTHPVLDKIENRVGEAHAKFVSGCLVAKSKFKRYAPTALYYAGTLLGAAALFFAGFYVRQYCCK